jgi:adenylate cyclase
MADERPTESGDDGVLVTATGYRSAAIAFADLVGYSALTEADPVRTHSRWMAMLTDILRPQAERCRGAVVQVMGDGVVAEFQNALDAVEWGRAVQRAILYSQSEQTKNSVPMRLRIGVHVGDLVCSPDGLFSGAIINIAARLQEYAEPGGLVVSGAVFEQLRETLEPEARDLGYPPLKNIESLVRAYGIDPERGAVPARSAWETLPSIAVLPLQNLGGDPADDYFAAGIVEDVIVSLSGLRELLVISRASTLIYHGTSPDPRRVGKALGVRYALMGSVRRSSEGVRVATQLCDARTGASLWGERVDFSAGALFDVQDRIVERIVSGIAPQVRAAELQRAMRKRPESFTAYECMLQAMHSMKGLDQSGFVRARMFLDRSMVMDPDFAMPVALAARWHSLRVGQGWSPNPQAEAAQGLELAARAIELDRQNAFALATYGHLRSYLFHDYDTALAYLERARAAGPSNSIAWYLSSATLSFVGRAEEAIRHSEHALRLSPFDPALHFFHTTLALAHYANGSYEEALRWGRLAESENPAYSGTLRYVAAALAATGRLDEAREVAARLLQLEPGFRLSEYERTRQPFRNPAARAAHMAHLRDAGLPE